MQFVDLHLHSKYSRACSGSISLDTLSENAKLKGLTVLGTGDFSHPKWNEELKSKLTEDNGIYEYNGMKFILSNEISLMYRQGGKGRRIHHVLLAPSLEIAGQINEFLKSRGRVDYDGRPIFGFSSIELTERLMSISKDIMIIPAHCLTPWFGIFGSMSGFDSLEECFQEKAKYVYAVETGLSANPEMLWRMPALDKVSLVSFSDAHSALPHRLGRECCALDCKPDYKEITDAIKSRNKFLYTIEFFPEEGKYHYDGHRNCNFSCEPKESRKQRGICPRCGNPLTIGVLSRVEELADRPEGFVPDNVIPFRSFVPLSELIAAAAGSDVYSKKMWGIYSPLIEKFGNELNVLLNADENDLKKITDEKIADIIIKNREGKLKIKPGYDGVYGELLISGKETEDKSINREPQNLKRFL